MDARYNEHIRAVTRMLGWMASVLLFVVPVVAMAAPSASVMAPYQGFFRSPTRVALDAQGNLYVSDSRAGQVIKLSTNGTVLATKSGLVKPLAIAVGNQGRVYVGEEGTGRVLVFDTALTNALASLGVGTNEFQLPNHIAVDPTQSNGWVYVSDSRTNQVRCYTNTTLVKVIGSKGSANGQFDFPAGLYVSPDRELYVVDQNNDRIQVFNSTGMFQRVFSLKTPADLVTTNIYGRPQGITSDGVGNVYVADAFQDEIKVFSTAGVYQTTFGALGEWIGQFRTPGSLAIGPDSRMFVSSVNNDRVEIFSVQASAVVMVTLQVVSPYGVPSPAAGFYTNVSGTVLTNSVSLTDPRGTTQYVCTGWNMTGNGPQAGVTNVMFMTHTNNAVLTWLWKTQYNLTVSAGTNGTVAVTNGWWDAGATTAASALPSPYYSFSVWTGTLSSAVNPLSITMSQPHNLTALFTATLATNGVPQWWLASYGLTNGGNWDAAALGDPDSDKMPTWQEWLADTVPTNGVSFLGFSGVTSSPAGVMLNWHGGILATQYLERTSALVGAPISWQAIMTNLPPTTVTSNLFTPSGTNNLFFFRIRSVR